MPHSSNEQIDFNIGLVTRHVLLGNISSQLIVSLFFFN